MMRPTTSAISTLVAFLTDVERLKLVKRRAYVSDFSRRENSAEHSWHLSLGLLIIAQELNLKDRFAQGAGDGADP